MELIDLDGKNMLCGASKGNRRESRACASFQYTMTFEALREMCCETLIDTHNEGAFVDQVVTTKFFTDGIGIHAGFTHLNPIQSGTQWFLSYHRSRGTQAVCD